MESIWLLCNEKSTPTTSNSHDSAADHEGSPCPWWKDQFLRCRRCNWWLVWHYRVGTWKTRTCIEEQIRRWSISVQKTTEQRVVERPKWRCELFQKVLATTFHQGSTIEPKQCSCIDSCSSWNTTEVRWICTSGWLDFNLLEIDLLSLGWISYQIWRPTVQK